MVMEAFPRGSPERFAEVSTEKLSHVVLIEKGVWIGLFRPLFRFRQHIHDARLQQEPLHDDQRIVTRAPKAHINPW